MIEALLAQLDRVTGYEPVGQGFESLAAHQQYPFLAIVRDGFFYSNSSHTVYLLFGGRCAIIATEPIMAKNVKEVLIMDIKAKIEELVEKVKNDKNFAADFKADPVKAVEKVIGVDLPDDQINKIIDGVKAKVSVDDVKDKVGGLLGKLGL